MSYDSPLLAFLAAAALAGRLGLGMYHSGMARSKNAAAGVLRVVIDLCVVVLSVWLCGYAIYWGDFHAIADANGTFSGQAIFLAVIFLWAMSPIAGAILERATFFPPMLAAFLMAGGLVPLLGYWAYHGWLARLGFVDIGGAGILHLSGGAGALAAAILLGPREGKYNTDGSSNFIPGHNVPFAAAGTIMMIVALLPSIMGSAMLHDADPSRAVAELLVAGCAGGLTSVILGHLRFGKPDLYLSLGGLMGAMVAASGSAGCVSTLAALVIGIIAGVVVPLSVVWLDLAQHIDDPCGGISSHGIAGLVGVIGTGLFLPGSVSHHLSQLGVQLLGAVLIATFAFAANFGLFLLLKKTRHLRLSEAEEFEGADLAQHDLNAYPDFQQTMIKSYHLRQA